MALVAASVTCWDVSCFLNPEAGLTIHKALRNGPLFVDPGLPLRQGLSDQRQHFQVGLGGAAPEVTRDGIRVFLDACQRGARFDRRTVTEWQSDDRLRLAARELFEALQFCDMTLADLECSKRKGYIAHAIELARAALAKAKPLAA
jgi:hypothetical protein